MEPVVLAALASGAAAGFEAARLFLGAMCPTEDFDYDDWTNASLSRVDCDANDLQKTDRLNDINDWFTHLNISVYIIISWLTIEFTYCKARRWAL